MPGKPQFCISLFRTISLATAALLFTTAFVPSFAQNPVPPTARQAAASPAFAQRLAHARATSSAPPAGRRASPQGNVLYENGPLNGDYDAWTINFGYIVRNNFTVSAGSTVTGFDFYTWSNPGDNPLKVDWSVTSAANGGTVYGSGTGASLANTIISNNSYGYQINQDTVSGLNVNLPAGTYWVNLQNAVTQQGQGLYWDENDGTGCKSPGCPSQASDNNIGTIGSETFDITGGGAGFPCFSEQRLSEQPQDGFKVIHDFTGRQGGGDPSGLAIDKAGNLYATADDGANGMAFKLAQEGSGWVLAPLYSFTGGYGGFNPVEMTVGPNGSLFGSARGGLQNCNGRYCGLVYSLRPPPTACLTSLCGWLENVLYRFSGFRDAFYEPPYGSGRGNLVFDQVGNLYGTSAYGGAQERGAIYQLAPLNGGWTERILYSFTGSDGILPGSLLVGNDGNLDGTTVPRRRLRLWCGFPVNAFGKRLDRDCSL